MPYCFKILDFILLLLILINITPSLANEGEQRAASQAERFASTFYQNLAELLYTAAAIDPESLQEDHKKRTRLLHEQDELQLWLTRLISSKETLSPTQYWYFRQIMANREFLNLPLRKRQRYIQTIQAYFADFPKHFSTSLDKLIGAEPRKTDLSLHFLKRLKGSLRIQIIYFKPSYHHSIAAIYSPAQAQIYLNLNKLALQPYELVDTIEHELWHHLLPVDLENIGDNLWWEGFTEAIAETWSFYYRQQCERRRHRPMGAIEYPIQTAFCSLFIALDSPGTLSYLSQTRNAKQFAQRLRNGSDHIRLRRYLAMHLLSPNTISKTHKKRIETLLKNWGWKEDDGTALMIDRFIFQDKLDAKKVTAAFRQEKQLLMDLIEALTVLILQDIVNNISQTKLRGRFTLPSQLETNLNTVLDYIRNPYHQFSNYR